MSQKSNITPTPLGNTNIITSTDSDGETRKEIDPYLSFEYNYKLNTYNIKSTLDEEEKLSFVAEKNNNSLGIFLAPSYLYKNPYLINTKRATTPYKEIGVLTAHKTAFDNNSSIELSYTISKITLQDDLIGKQTTSLSREGYIHTLTCSSTNSLFRLDVGTLKTDGMGSAEGYKGLNGKVSTAYPLGSVQVFASAMVEHRFYNNINPIFSQTRRQTNTKLSISLENDFTSGYYMTVGIATRHNNSNIKFFNESANEMLLGIGKNF